MKTTEEEKELLNVFKYNQENMNSLLEKTINKTIEMKKSNDDKGEFIKESDTKLEQARALLKEMGIDLSDIQETMEVYKSNIKKEYKDRTECKNNSDIKEKSYDELVELAHQNGYIGTTFEDLLTLEEITEAESRCEEINKIFREKTKLKKLDITFLIIATALQCIRQYVLTTFEERFGHDEGDKRVKDYEKSWKERFPEDIQDIFEEGVPYDVTYGSKELGLGSDGKGYDSITHRYRTLGHDPILGWVFGTINILTSTLTDWRLLSFKVKKEPDKLGILRKKIVKNPGVTTPEVLKEGFNKALDKKVLLAATIIKQGIHIKSDVGSKVGLPIPLVSTSISPEFAEKLADIGIDFQNVLTVGKQATYSIVINTIIAMIHALFYDENKYKSRELYEVKTRKILLYSNLLASSSNIIVVACTKDVKKLDIGGLLVTIGRLFSDIRFITKVKDDFIKMELDKDLQVQIDKLDSILGEIEN